MGSQMPYYFNGGSMLIFLFSLFACGEDEASDTASDTAVTVESTEQIGANFFCGQETKWGKY